MDAPALTVVLSALDQATGPCKKVSDSLKEATGAASKTRKELKHLKDQQKDLSGYKAMGQELSRLGAKQSEAKSKLRALRQQIVSTETPSKSLTDSYKAQLREVKKLDRGYKKYQAKIKSASERLKAAGIDTKNLSSTNRTLRDSVKQVTAQLEKQEAVQKRLAKQNKALTEARNKYSSRREMANTSAMVGIGLVASGAGAARMLFQGAQTGIDFEKVMSALQANTQLGKEDPQMKAMRKQARQLGASTVFSSSDAGQAQVVLSQAGFSPKEIMAAMPGLLSTAAAGDLDIATTADIVSNVLRGFKLATDQTGHVADVLTQAAISTNTSIEMLGQTMKYVAPVAQAAGMSLESTTAMAGLLANIGIKSDMAGTQLREMLTAIASPTSAARKQLNTLHVKTTDSHGELRDITAILADVAKGLEGKGSGTRLNALTTIFGQRAGTGMSALIDKKGIGAITQMTAALKDANGVAKQVAATRMDNLAGSIEQLSGSWDDLKITLFEGNKGPLRSLVNGIGNLVDVVNDFLKEHPMLASALGQIVFWFATGAIVIGTLITAFGAATLTMGLYTFALETSAAMGGKWLIVNRAMRAALWLMKTPLLAVRGALLLVSKAFRILKLMMATNPIGLLLVLLATLAVLVYRNWAPIKAFFVDIFTAIGNSIDMVINKFKALTNSWIGKKVASWFGDDDETAAVATSAKQLKTRKKLKQADTEGQAKVLAGKTAAAKPVTVQQHNEFAITISAAPGMDEDAIAKKVADAIADQQRAQARQQRSALFDVG